MKNILLMGVWLISAVAYSQNCNFKLHSPGAPSNNYKCISIDQLGNVWAGTNKEGLFKMQDSVWSKHPILTNNDINQIAADKNGGVWIAQAGNSTTTAAGGGVDYIAPGSNTSTRYLHSYTNNNREGYGLASAKVTTVAIDQNGTVWAAGGYSSLTVTGVGGTYLLSPGGVAIMRPGQDRFTQITEFIGMAQFDRPYTPDITATGCLNRPYDIAVGKNVVGVGFNAIADCAIDGRARIVSVSNPNMYGSAILHKFPYSFTKQNSPFAFASNIYPQALHFDKHNNLWMGTRGQGFGVYKYSENLNVNNYWISFKDSLPANTTVNPHAIASSKSGFVAIGTDIGLYIYMGTSDIGKFSNLKHFDISNSNLPSNNITGVAFDHTGTLWVSTDKGIVSVNFGDLKMYNLVIDPSFYDPHLYKLSSFDDDSKRVLIEKFRTSNCFSETEDTEDLPSIAADGSKSTLFIWKGANPDFVKLKIKENVLNNRDEYGYFEEIPQNDRTDSVKFRYHHPAYIDGLYTLPNSSVKKIITIEARDTVNNRVLFSSKVQVVLPPVLILHGIFGNSDKLKNMKDVLVESQVYTEDMVYQGGFKDPKVGFSVEYLGYTMRDQIDEIQKTCAENGVSIGKVDVLGHSSGGLATRWYIQNIFRKDINKFISIHVPHSGSQYVDLLADKRTFGPSGVELGAFLMGPTFLEDKYGYSNFSDFIPYDAPVLGKGDILATFLQYYASKTLPIPPTTFSLFYEKEIKTNSEFLKKLNSPENLKKEADAKVFSHAITDQFRYGITEVETEFIKSFLDNMPGTGIPAKRLTELKYARLANIPLTILNYLVISKLQSYIDEGFTYVTQKALNKVTDTTGLTDIFYREEIFKDYNDAVASLSSQRGGLPEAAVTYGGNRMVSHESSESISHMQNTFDNANARFEIVNLLREDSKSAKFTQGGFNPPKLKYTFCEGCSFLQGPIDNQRQASKPGLSKTNADELTITQVNGPQVAQAHDSLTFLVESSNTNIGMTSVFVYSQNSDPLYTFSKVLPSNFKMAVPKEAFGDMLVVAQSFDTLNNVMLVDTLTFKVALKEGVKIDSFKLITQYEDRIFLHLEDTVHIYANAYYSDSTTRIIKIDTSFSLYNFTGRFSLAGPHIFTGLSVGIDMLKVAKNGYLDSVMVEVMPKLSQPDVITSVTDNNEVQDEFKEMSLEKASESFRIYPNPTNAVVNIEAVVTPQSPVEISIYNDMGRLLYRQMYTNFSAPVTLSTQNFAEGLYYVSVKDAINTRTILSSKLVIAR